ncbi:MAG: mechanosensitive ion channel family protein [Candidatus Acidiferrales bacterium]
MPIITPRQERSQRFIAGALLCLAAFFIGSAGEGAAPPIDRDAILNHLNTIISWYRDSGSKIQSVGLPSDAIYQDTSQNLAQQAVRLAFQSAQAAAALVNASDQSAAPASADASGNSTPQQNLAQTLAALKTRIDQDQSLLDALNKKLATAPPGKRQSLAAQRDSLQGEIALDQATQDAVQKLATFAESSEESGVGGFSGSINDLARTVPEVLGDANAQKAAAKPAAAQPTISKSSGLIGQALTLYTELRTMHNIDQLANETARVRDDAAALRKPMRDTLAATIQHGRNLTSQTPPSNPAQVQAAQQELRSLTGQFKQLSNVVIPLSQEMLVLDQSRANFLNWRNSIARESKDSLRAVVTSALAILLALGVVWGLSEIWRRWTFRYIHDLRRRRQFLLLRRFVMGFLICAVLTLGIVSDFSSLATFAGFATAGIAVGLQAVLLSVAAYFFVIGRYGIRIGDRVSIAGVTGDVIDVSPVRFYLMELAGSDVNLFPTGRIVVFSNSVLFQATTPLYKQIPGTEYTWHEVVLQFVAGADYKLAEEKLLAAVNSVYGKYKDDIERQHNDLERRIEIQMKAPAPQAKLHYADTGLEFLVRYPTELRTAPEIDEEVIKAVLGEIEKDPKLKAAVTGWPRIRAAVKA